tara:strand:- start:17 stop:595 length:579 start_codon:yes stop_codon:yes gene_type:complete
MILSILIPTTTDRKPVFDRLVKELKRQCVGKTKQVEIISLSDDKKITIGEKRNKLYDMANGLYSWQIDDDDWIHPEAVNLILKAAEQNKDCITFQEIVIFDGGRPKSSNFSLEYLDWKDNSHGYDYIRTPFFKTPIKTDICKRVQVPLIRFGEDHEWAKAVKPLLQSEMHINDNIYWYLHYSTPFNERYGIK